MAELSAVKKAPTRADCNIALVGSTNHQILGSKLPSKKQVLQVLFYNLRFVKLNLRDSARLVLDEVFLFWRKARIPTQIESRCIEKVEKLYKEWRNLQKTSSKSVAQLQKEAKFVEDLDDLFDVAHGNALEMIKIEEDRKFLLLQKRKGRPGVMMGCDMNLHQKEKRKAVRTLKEENRKMKQRKMQTETEGQSNICLE